MTTRLWIYLISAIVLICGKFVHWLLKPNFFNKHTYIRVVRYNDDMSIDVKFIKRQKFNQDDTILINPKHVFNCNGYTSVILTSNSQESINPLDFNSKYDSKDFKTAIRSKVIKDTFETLKPDRFDKLTLLLVLTALQFLAIAYLLYSLLGGQTG